MNKINQIICHFSFHFAKWDFPKPHVSDNSKQPRPFYAFMLPLKGTMSFESNECFTASVNDLVFIPKGCTYIGNWSENTSYIVLFFNIDSLDIAMDKYSYQVQKITHPEIKYLIESFSKGLKYFNNKQKNFLSLCSLAYSILDKCLPLVNRDKKNYSPSIRTAMDYITTNCTNNDLRVNDYARIVHMSVSQFYDKFKDETGMSPNDFKNHAKIQYAISLLQKNNYSMEELTTLSGFNSSVHFRKTFRKIMGENPSSFSKSIYKI